MASLGITATVQRVGGGLPIKIKFAVSAERNGRRCQLASARSYAIGAISSSASTPPSEAQRWNVPIASIKLGWNSWGLPCGLGGYVAPRAIFVSNNGARFIILPYKHTKRKTNHLRLLGSSGAPPVRSPTPPQEGNGLPRPQRRINLWERTSHFFMLYSDSERTPCTKRA